MAKVYCVYAHINKINHKMYIGQTCNIKCRWYPNSYKCSRIFYNAIQKYGWENFEHIILEDNILVEDIDEKEKYYIKKYKTTDREYGYNLLDGGESNHILSDETKKLISEGNKKYWKEHPEQEKYKLEQAWKGSRKKVICLNNGLIFDSQIQAAEYANLKTTTGISKCCLGQRKGAGKDPVSKETLHWAFYQSDIQGEIL